MRGAIRPISLPRRVIIEMMHAAMRVPFVSLRRTLDVGALIEARDALADRPGWAAIFAKAFCLVARDEPVLRTLYATWPWPHFYELPRSVGMVAIARCENGEDCVLPQKLTAPDQQPLAQVDAAIRHAMTADINDVPSFRKLLRISRLPQPLRRLVWAIGMNFGRQRANYSGNFGITSVAAFGPGELQALSPGPFLVTYGTVNDDRTIDVLIRWDHRVTDAAMIATTLTRMEQALNGAIAAELRANAAPIAQKLARAVVTS